MSHEKVLILGAGQLSSHLIDFLLPRGFKVSVLVRDPKKADAFKEKGAEVVLGDMKDEGVVKPALKGVHTIISTVGTVSDGALANTNMPIAAQNQVMAWAAAEGVKHFIPALFSFRREVFGDIITDYQLTKEVGVQSVKESGLNWTVFFTGCFIETWTLFIFDVENGKASIPGNGENPVPWIGYKDLAQFIALSVANPKFVNKEVDLVTENTSFNEVLKIFETVYNKKFAVTYSSLDELKSAFKQASEPTKSFITLQHAVASAKPVSIELLKEFYPNYSILENLDSYVKKQKK